MDKKVLIIGQPNSFMLNSIVNGLKKAGYETPIVEADMNAISRQADKPKIWLLYLDGKEENLDELCVFINDFIIEQEISFYAVGNADELADVLGIIQDKIKGSFSRPINVKLIVDEMDKAVEEGSRAEEKKKILIIDDNPTTLRTMKGLLSDTYNVFMVNSGMNGITFLATNKVDLILLDYEMPVVTGPQVLEMLRSEESTRDIPVMFLTAKGDRESVLKVVSLKPEKYLLKTMPPQELIKNIDDFFEARKGAF
ncbi:MAG: response regulator [Lachnospiraceae bacterium]|nr:response regulator [Lachnospiraceae bacterium]